MTLNISLSEMSTDLEKAEAIRDVMQHAVTMSQAVALAKEMKSWPLRPITLAVIAIASLALTAYTFLAEADWAYGPDPAAVAPARHDAHLRFALFLTAQRLEAFREANGTLPGSLAEAGEDWPAVDYQPTDSIFVLRARAASGEPIVLQSNADMKVFLGNSRGQLRERRP